uniref:Uncharacterized protein n=1 Tax=Ciona intestinalis TaxID=7719 RepID=F6PSU1_CIOIN
MFYFGGNHFFFCFSTFEFVNSRCFDGGGALYNRNNQIDFLNRDYRYSI